MKASKGVKGVSGSSMPMINAVAFHTAHEHDELGSGVAIEKITLVKVSRDSLARSRLNL